MADAYEPSFVGASNLIGLSGTGFAFLQKDEQ